jgi:glutamate synthase (NADPH/NADH) small chain
MIEPRIEQMREEGVSFQTGVQVGVDLGAAELRRSFDAVLLCCGAEQPRDLPIEGRELAGIHYAMDFLSQQNHRDAGDPIDPADEILAGDKHVVILGGGDTGSDCVGTSHRQGAASVTSIELLERPPDRRSPATPWPLWPLMFRTSSSHEEGGVREFGMLTKRFHGADGRVRELETIGVRFQGSDAAGRPRLEEIPGTERRIRADLVLLAMGFVGPIHAGLLTDLGLRRDARGNVAADLREFATSEPGVFAAGDCRRGQSLVVWALWEGREAARAIDRYLCGSSWLQARSAHV